MSSVTMDALYVVIAAKRKLLEILRCFLLPNISMYAVRCGCLVILQAINITSAAETQRKRTLSRFMMKLVFLFLVCQFLYNDTYRGVVMNI